VDKNRLEAFSDGVIAIIITIMVLELRPPHDPTWASLAGLWPIGISYVLSFIYLGIYWNNHHHMLKAVRHVGGGVLWANLHLLFWLSLVPFATAWMGETNFAAVPVALYGVVLIGAAIAYFILSTALIARHGKDSTFAQAIGSDFKGKISVVIYAVGIGVSLVAPTVAGALYTLVALIWLIPDRRIERALAAAHEEAKSQL